MKLLKVLFFVLIGLFVLTSAAVASDFGWIEGFNIQAQADPSGFKAQLATRFKIGNVQVDALLSNVAEPADAYLMLRLGEMSGKPVDYVIEKYKHNKGKGWGALAKSLGIKPGSEEFHALKRGHDLDDKNRYDKVRYSSYDHSHDNDGKYESGKGKGKK
jgi:hypothetical protein